MIRRPLSEATEEAHEVGHQGRPGIAASVAALRAGGPSDAELDALYEQFTQEALKAGVFGAPSYVLPSGEIFWGQDRLDLLERALKMLG